MGRIVHNKQSNHPKSLNLQLKILSYVVKIEAKNYLKIRSSSITKRKISNYPHEFKGDMIIKYLHKMKVFFWFPGGLNMKFVYEVIGNFDSREKEMSKPDT